MNVFKTLLQPGGTILLAGDISRKSPLKFFDMLRNDFQIAGSRHTLRAQDETHVIGLYRLSHIKFHSVIGCRRITIQPSPSILRQFNM